MGALLFSVKIWHDAIWTAIFIVAALASIIFLVLTGMNNVKYYYNTHFKYKVSKSQLKLLTEKSEWVYIGDKSKMEQITELNPFEITTRILVDIKRSPSDIYWVRYSPSDNPGQNIDMLAVEFLKTHLPKGNIESNYNNLKAKLL